MDYQAIESLIKEMGRTDLTLVEIESDNTHIRLERNIHVIDRNSILPTTVTKSELSGNTDMTIEEKKESKEKEQFQTITAPMVGTFYASASPDGIPMVQVGDKIKKGQKVCIIEAMKLMNEIESEYDGEIAEILVENEEMVEYGQPLFYIR